MLKDFKESYNDFVLVFLVFYIASHSKEENLDRIATPQQLTIPEID